VSYKLVSKKNTRFLRTGVESPKKTVDEACQTSSGCCDVTTQCDKATKKSSNVPISLSRYIVKKNMKNLNKTDRKNYEDFSMSYIQLPLIKKLDELIQKELTFYKVNARQRCFKCRKYGHIAKECAKICPKCHYFHPNKLCINTMIQNLEEVICTNYMSFAKQYDKLCSSIENLSKVSFSHIEVNSCQQLNIKPSILVRPVEYIKKEELIGERSKINNEKNQKLNTALHKMIADYAHINKVDVKKIQCISHEKYDCIKGLIFGVIPKFEKNNFLQYMGSGIYAKFSYSIYYEDKNVIMKKEVIKPKKIDTTTKLGMLCDSIDEKPIIHEWIYRQYQEEVKYNQDPVFLINQGHHMNYNFNHGTKIKMERFNKMLRLYTSKDELEVKYREMEAASKQLANMRKQIENESFNCAIIDEEYKLKIDGLKQKYKDIHQNLINETRAAKKENFKQLNNVKKNCIKQAKQVVLKKKQYIEKAKEELAKGSEAGLFENLKQTKWQIKSDNMLLDNTWNANGINYIQYKYQSSNTLHLTQFEDLGKYKIPKTKVDYNTTHYEVKQQIINFIDEYMNAIKNKRVSYKDQQISKTPIVKESSGHCYDSESDSEE
jgi:hypothetical protein